MAGEDLGIDIASNIGYMPIVNALGSAGSGFMNFLSSLMPGQSAQDQAPAAKAAQPSGGGFMDILNSIVDPVKMGLRSTADAFQGDVSKVAGGHLPSTALRDLQRGMAMAGGGMGGPTMPATESRRMADWVFDPERGWIATNIEKFPSVNPLNSLYYGNPQGDLAEILKQLFIGGGAMTR